MEFDVKPYKQRGNTCAIVCMLIVLEYYKIISKVDWIYERKYHRIYKSKYMEGTPFSAIAWHLSKNELDVELVHSENNLFDNSKQILPNDIFNNAITEYKEYLDYAKSKGARIYNGIDITSCFLKDKLCENKLIILAGQTNGILHAILICGYKNNKFIVCDPLYKQKLEKTKEEINEYMRTDLGKWCVAVGKKC